MKDQIFTKAEKPWKFVCENFEWEKMRIADSFKLITLDFKSSLNKKVKILFLAKIEPSDIHQIIIKKPLKDMDKTANFQTK